MDKQFKYVTIMPQDTDRFEFASIISQIEPNVGLLHYRNISEFRTAIKITPSIFSKMEGLYIKLEDNLNEVLKLIQEVQNENNRSYVIVLASVMEIQALSSLIQNGVSQVLMWPYSLQDLRNKMKSAEIFQQNVIRDLKQDSKAAFFNFWVESFTKNTYAVSLKGWISTKDSLPAIVPEVTGSILFIDCDGLRGLSSVGVRMWMIWIKQLKLNGFNHFIFQNLRSAFVNLAGVVKELIPENAEVSSFYLIYYNDAADVEKEFKFVSGEHFDDVQLQLPSEIESEFDGQKLIFKLDQDVRILTFYKGKISRLEYLVAR